MAGLLLGHLESANSPSGLVSPAAQLSLLEHAHISAEWFSASPSKKNKIACQEAVLASALLEQTGSVTNDSHAIITVYFFLSCIDYSDVERIVLS